MSFRHILSAEEISGLNIDSVTWLLVIYLMLIYNENEQVGQKKYEMYSWARKRAPGNLMLEP